MSQMLRIAFAASVAALATAGTAVQPQAGARLNFFFQPFYDPGYYEPYYPPQAYAPPPRYYYYYDEYPRPRAYDQAYGFDDGYYEPEYQPQARPLRKQALKPLDDPQLQQLAPPPKKEKKAASLLSCSKATSVVSGYGFSDIKSLDCKGQVYAFNAARDGKKFAIKLNAVNGELTEVKKL